MHKKKHNNHAANIVSFTKYYHGFKIQNDEIKRTLSEIRYAYRNLIPGRKMKAPLGRQRCIYNLKVLGSRNVNWIQLLENRFAGNLF